MTASSKPTPSPLLAALLSALLPGLGQVFARQRYRGVSIFIGFAVLTLTTLWYADPRWYISPALVWLWNIWDAVRQAGGRKNGILLPVLAGLAAAYGIGWQVLQIDFSQADMSRAVQIVRPMLEPNFVQERRELNQMWVEVYVPCGADVPAARHELDGKIALVTPDCAAVLETVIVNVSGMWPNAETEIWWETPIGDARMLGENEAAMLIQNTDENGSLTAVIHVPSLALAGAPDPTISLPHRVYFDQYRPVGGYELSFVGKEVLKGALTTIAMALMATLFAIVLAIPVSFLAARNLMSGNPVTMTIYVVVRTLLNILRSIESLIIAFIFVKIVGLGPFAGMLALAVHSIAALAKLYSEVIEGIDPGPIEAIRATGANWVQVVRYGVIPQIVPPFTAFTIYRWDINVRSATIVGFVGGGGIGFLLIELIRISDMRGVSAVFITIAVIVVALDYLSAKVRERLV
ncbi:MAG: phosphonate ABC transporter, permease protein PhnE [Chloroflexota bacterium]